MRYPPISVLFPLTVFTPVLLLLHFTSVFSLIYYSIPNPHTYLIFPPSYNFLQVQFLIQIYLIFHSFPFISGHFCLCIFFSN
jgi:hypothetical protein